VAIGRREQGLEEDRQLVGDCSGGAEHRPGVERLRLRFENATAPMRMISAPPAMT